MDIVAGGDGTTVSVTGTRLGSGDYNPRLPGNGGSGSGSGGGGGGGYVSPNRSTAANNFANKHLKQLGSTAADLHAYQLAHDDLAALYDYTQAHPNDIVNLGNGKSTTFSSALSDINNVTFNISDTGGGSTGANTQPNSTFTSYTITYNTQNQNSKDYASRQGDAGINYGIFHELGHVLEGSENRSDFTNEASANTAARSLESQLGIAQMTAPPGYGYD
jgi:hypothetical protein